MSLSAKLALSQLKVNRRTTVWTLVAIILSVVLLTAVYGFALGGRDLMNSLTVGQMEAVGGVVITDDGIAGTAEFVERQLLSSRRFTQIFATIAAALTLIIGSISALVIANAFKVSTTKRLNQFGLLKSVGATNRQISQSVIWESVFLAVVAIPAGLLLGLAVQFTGVQIINHYLMTIIRDAGTLNFTVAWPILLAAALLAFGTVLLSAWLPARKASRVSAIKAMRNYGEIQAVQTNPRLEHLVSRVFGFSGLLALRQNRRNRRSYRATVVSLTLGVVLLIALGGFTNTLHRASQVAFRDFTEATVVAQVTSPGPVIDSQTAELITTRLRDFAGSPFISVGSLRMENQAQLPVELMTPELRVHASESWFWDENSEYQSLPVTFITTDSQTYAALASIAGVPLGANILLNHFSAQFQSIEPDGTLGAVQFVDLVPYRFEPMNLQISDRDGNSPTTLAIDGQLHRNQIPAEVWDAAFGDMLIVIVPELVSANYLWYASPADSWAFSNYAEIVLAEYLTNGATPTGGDQTGIHTQVLNLEEEQGVMTGTATMINILIYGFAAMLMLIGMTNIVSTISTSVFARSREFAALKSVGLDQGALNKMLTFEALFSALKAVIFGLPIGLLAAYLIHRAVTDTIAFAFEPPIVAISLSIIGVPAITWAVTRFSATRLRGQNLISAIRDIGQ